jgi:hypothetical protein
MIKIPKDNSAMLAKLKQQYNIPFDPIVGGMYVMLPVSKDFIAQKTKAGVKPPTEKVQKKSNVTNQYVKKLMKMMKYKLSFQQHKTDPDKIVMRIPVEFTNIEPLQTALDPKGTIIYGTSLNVIAFDPNTMDEAMFEKVVDAIDDMEYGGNKVADFAVAETLSVFGEASQAYLDKQKTGDQSITYIKKDKEVQKDKEGKWVAKKKKSGQSEKVQTIFEKIPGAKVKAHKTDSSLVMLKIPTEHGLEVVQKLKQLAGSLRMILLQAAKNNLLPVDKELVSGLKIAESSQKLPPVVDAIGTGLDWGPNKEEWATITSPKAKSAQKKATEESPDKKLADALDTISSPEPQSPDMATPDPEVEKMVAATELDEYVNAIDVPGHAGNETYKKPQTIDDAVVYCKSLGIEASFPDIETAREMTKAISEQHPLIQKHVQFVGTSSQLKSWAKKNPEINNLAKQGKHAIDLSKKSPLGGGAAAVAHPIGPKPYTMSAIIMMNSLWQKATTAEAGYVGDSSFSISSAAGDTLRHEFGHVEAFVMRHFKQPGSE